MCDEHATCERELALSVERDRVVDAKRVNGSVNMNVNVSVIMRVHVNVFECNWDCVCGVSAKFQSKSECKRELDWNCERKC